MSNPLIVIPARMGSTRFPGKPLAEIAGISMLRRTVDVARQVQKADYVVATDSVDIQSHCQSFGIPVVMTSPDVQSGSDRALAALDTVNSDADIVVNLQGDAPFTNPSHVKAVIDGLSESDADIATPYIQLDWAALDILRNSKKETPFSGTTLIENGGRAIWFSKNIIPAMRDELAMREATPLSPVCRHIGLYAFRHDALKRYTTLPISSYEKLEGLEQLRALENGMSIAAIKVLAPRISSPGIDTPQDLVRAEELIAEFGDPFKGAL